MDNYSQACCSIPPVIGTNYEPKGEYTTLNGLKTYVTGPTSATCALLSIYDIFGFFPQTLQGADLLASAGPYRVFLPDFFEGKPCNIEWYPPTTEEKKTALYAWFGEKGSFDAGREKVPGIISEANAMSPDAGKFEKWGVLGYCWGGHLATVIAGGEETVFSAAVQVHPGVITPADAGKVTIPMAVLASKDEKKEEVEEFMSRLKGEKFVEWFDSQIHGWMSARGDLEDEGVRMEYERGYQIVLNFFKKHV
ncbi:alpha/beta-hydrolase [Aulographum hederae CBS 113979]|uniref:Alpha/beta-hydrolase n=1 Tax=Aulographum hederae CBS 113979 TaxID=1176131 RepID=A0A6G1GPK5_9PEZI|nr:alpha/beta-hydrolase [Aulographum hederae CBS 113979]